MDELDIIKSFNQKRVLLIGDTILDIYTYGKEVCKSSDSRATEIEEEKTEVSFGGASGVANNILELGGSVIFFSVVGDDETAKHYSSFNHPKLEKHFLIDKTRPTIIKKRFWVNGHKIFQTNQVDNRDISPELEKEFIEKIEPLVGQVDLILALDPRHGLLTETLITNLVHLSKRYQKPLYVDAQCYHRPSNHYSYRGADCLFLNETEARIVYPGFDINNPEPSLKGIRGSLQLSNVVIKLGEEGSMALFNGKYIKSPAFKTQVVDPCGAGDAFLAAFSLSNREVPEKSLAIANSWAALSTTIQGTRPPSKKELIKICKS